MSNTATFNQRILKRREISLLHRARQFSTGEEMLFSPSKSKLHLLYLMVIFFFFFYFEHVHCEFWSILQHMVEHMAYFQKDPAKQTFVQIAFAISGTCLVFSLVSEMSQLPAPTALCF